MQVTQAILLDFVGTIAADTGVLAAATAMKVKLVASAFTPSPQLVLADVTLASFPGSDPLDAGTGAQTVFFDPVTGHITIRVLEPAGGWSWLADDVVVTPETIYGYIVTDTAGTLLIGSALLPTPVTIDEEGQGLEIGSITLQFLPNSPF